MWTLYRLFSLIAFVSVVRSQSLSSDEFEQKVFLDQQQNFQMLWNFNSTHILIQLRVATTGWIGVGFSALGSMAYADIHVGWVSGGRAIITDRHGLDGNTFPPLDSEQNVELIEGKECNGKTVITFVRQLAACQQREDREITSQTTRVIYAYSQRDPVNELSWSDYHGFENRGSKSLLLLQSQMSKETPVNDPDARTFDVVADGKALPRKKTFYKCQLMKLPEFNKIHHVIKMEPVINPLFARNVHHITIHSCEKAHDQILEQIAGNSGDCFDDQNIVLESVCLYFFGGWAVGGGAILLPNNTGLPIGEEKSSRFIQLEIHYDNPYKKEIRDNSGMRLTYTPNLRKHHAGAIAIGLPPSAAGIIVPPNISNFEIYGECPSSCLGGAMKKARLDHINVFEAFPHAHYAARKMELRHFRDHSELPPVMKDDFYDFDYQEFRLIKPMVKIRKGDELMAVCSYSSMGKSYPIVGGLDTWKEMCVIYITYYPRIPLQNCLSNPLTPINDYLKKILNVSEILDTSRNWRTLYKDIDDWKVTSPRGKFNQSIGDLMSSVSWDTDKVKGLEKTWKRSYKFSICLGPQPEVPGFSFRPPFKQRAPYRFPSPQQCPLPFMKFVTQKPAATCQAKI